MLTSEDTIIGTNGKRTIARRVFDGEITAEGSATEVIQGAIDQQAELGGGTVSLLSGAFQLEAPLTMRSGIRLRGQGRSTTLVAPASAGDSAGIFCQGLKQATISDLTVRAKEPGQPGAGIVVDDCGETEIRDVQCADLGDYGIWLRANSFLSEIRGCRLVNNGKANLYLDALWCGRGGDWVPNLVTNCLIYGGGTGIELHQALLTNIVACMVFQAGGHGFHFHDDGGSNLISGCRTFQIEKDAVRVERSNELNITGNIFCWHRGSGIVFDKIGCGVISGNEVIDSGVRTRDGSLASAIVLENDTRTIQISNNTIFNFGDQCPMEWAITEDATCHNNNIVSNNINYCAAGDISSHGKDTQVALNTSETAKPFLNANETNPYADFDRRKLTNYLADG